VYVGRNVTNISKYLWKDAKSMQICSLPL
jgi:hypothetical protein